MPSPIVFTDPLCKQPHELLALLQSARYVLFRALQLSPEVIEITLSAPDGRRVGRGALPCPGWAIAVFYADQPSAIACFGVGLNEEQATRRAEQLNRRGRPSGPHLWS